VVPETVMPPYPHLAADALGFQDVAEHLRTNRTVGVPYTDEMIELAWSDLRAQADPDGDHEGLLSRYPKAAVGDLDGDPGRLTEMDAIVAYLQILGRMVDFTDIQTEDILQ
jgi:cytochrome c oxidase cbb3-type subunit 2